MLMCYSDLTGAMSALNLQQASALQQQRLAETQNLPYADKAPVEAPLTAPQPTRATQSPAAGMWTPEMPIRFGDGTASPAAAATKPRDARWDPTKGMRFG